MTSTTLAAPLFRGDRLETASLCALLGFVAALQLSIAAAGILLALTLLCWAGMVATQHERIEVPRMFWPLVAYGAATLVSALFSADPTLSLVDCKQLVVFLIVPVVYRMARGRRALTLTNVIITVGAISAVAGIVQYGILHYDNLGRRPQGALTHYMTYSGLLMLVAGVAAARLLYRDEERVWPALIMPAVLVALALTFTRSAWVGACAAFSVLLVIKDRRLLAVLPVVAALFIAVAPARLTDRVYSMFDMKDPTNRDRVAMLQGRLADGPGPPAHRSGTQHGAGDLRAIPVARRRRADQHPPAQRPDADRGRARPPRAADLAGVRGDGGLRHGAEAADLAGTRRSLPRASRPWSPMLAAGMFEYNFGDSEFLMLFLVLVTLPYAAERQPDSTTR